MGAGVKESEISYQMAFSRQELRRVVKEYPAREVKKGLEHLYRKVEKHLCEEENLLQVIMTLFIFYFVILYFASSIVDNASLILIRLSGEKCKGNLSHNT